MTEDVIITAMTNTGTTATMDDNNNNNRDDIDLDETQPTRTSKYTMTSYIKSMILFLRSNHTSIIMFFILLQGIDMYIIQHCINHILNAGQPSVKILFAFEAAILLVSTYCHVILYVLHVIDCSIQYGHDILENAVAKRLLHPWKEYKATFIFAIELQAQAINFLFYCTFFCIVLTFYGLPINLFREVYMSFMKLKERLTSFIHYRQLMASMNRFRTATDEELNESGRTCIICRDEMTSGHDCKRLPVCNHTFHKSCLREWLVQQQSCPTCRADIAAMEALETSRSATANAATQRTTTNVDSTNATTTSDDTTDPETTADTVPIATTSNTMTDTNPLPSKPVSATNNNPSSSIDRDTIESSNKNAIDTTSYSNTSTVIRANNQDVGVIQPIPPTLYEVVGTHNSANHIASDDAPVYAHESIVTEKTSSLSILDDSNQTTLIPIRTICKNTLVLGMAKYHIPQSPPSLSTPKAASTNLITFVQLPDQTWMPYDCLQMIYILPQNEKFEK
jgi:hypothetical protein